MKLEGGGEKQRSAATPSTVITHRFRECGPWRGHLRASRSFLKRWGEGARGGSNVTIESLCPRSVTFPLLFNNFEKSKTRNTNSFQFF